MRRGALPSAPGGLSSWGMEQTPGREYLDRRVLSVLGADAATFLQGLISNDVQRAAGTSISYAFMLTPQGKYLFDFFLVAVEGGYWLDVDAADADALAAKLGQYKLRAKVQIGRADCVVYADLDGEPFETTQAFARRDPRHSGMGVRLYLPASEYGGQPGAAAAYRARRFALGIPESEDFRIDPTFLLDCNGEELHGVDFRKGCYVGQELTARMKHRGTARRRILRVSGDGIATGASILDSAREIGQVLSVQGASGLAMIRLDRWREARGRPLTANGAPVEVALPAYPLLLPPEEAAS
jgi:tRNA-modifying protein YgfZ